MRSSGAVFQKKFQNIENNFHNFMAVKIMVIKFRYV